MPHVSFGSRRQTSDASWFLLTQACSGVAVQMCKPPVDSENPKRPVTQQMSAVSEQRLLLVFVPSGAGCSCR